MIGMVAPNTALLNRTTDAHIFVSAPFGCAGNDFETEWTLDLVARRLTLRTPDGPLVYRPGTDPKWVDHCGGHWELWQRPEGCLAATCVCVGPSCAKVYCPVACPEGAPPAQRITSGYGSITGEFGAYSEVDLAGVLLIASATTGRYEGSYTSADPDIPPRRIWIDQCETGLRRLVIESAWCASTVAGVCEHWVICEQQFLLPPEVPFDCNGGNIFRYDVSSAPCTVNPPLPDIVISPAI